MKNFLCAVNRVGQVFPRGHSNVIQSYGGKERQEFAAVEEPGVFQEIPPKMEMKESAQSGLGRPEIKGDKAPTGAENAVRFTKYLLKYWRIRQVVKHLRRRDHVERCVWER
jgi:hypothetical protein